MVFKKGHEVPQEWRLAVSKARKGKPSWISGKHHTEESNQKNRKAHLGKPNLKLRGRHPSDETRKKMSKIRVRLFREGKIKAPFEGKHLYEETKKKLSIAHTAFLQKNLDEDGKSKNHPFYGKHQTKEAIEKSRLAHLGKSTKRRGKTYEEEYGFEKSKNIKEKMRQRKIGIPLSMEHIKKLTESQKLLWQNQEHKERMLEKMFAGLKMRPTSLDRQFTNDFIIKHSLPLRYVGDGAFHLGWKYPDFINVNGEKVCVEVRSIEVTKHLDKITPEEYEKQRIEHFAKWGWKCVVLFASFVKNKWIFEKSNAEILNELGVKEFVTHY